MRHKHLIHRLAALVLCVMLLLSLTACGSKTQKTEAEIIQDARSGVVRVLVLLERNNEVVGCITGSGFGVGTAGEETNYFVTNWHVITDSGSVNPGAFPIYILTDDDAVVIQYDRSGTKITDIQVDYTKLIRCSVLYSADQYPDVAILKAEKKVPGRTALKLKSSKEVTVASTVYSLGYPGVADMSSVDSQNRLHYYGGIGSIHVESGSVSKLDKFAALGNTYCIEHGAHINNGNSGGPLLDSEGYVVGINTYTLKNDNFINYSVYTDYVMGYLNQLGIQYDSYNPTPVSTFPIVPVALGGAAVVLVLVVMLVVVRVRMPKPKAEPMDTGLRVQYNANAMMSGRRIVISDTLRFGRAPDCNVQYAQNAPGISNHHCEIVLQEGQIFIRDLSSTHGTFVNGSRIPANQLVPLSMGTSVSLASPNETFQIVRSTRM